MKKRLPDQPARRFDSAAASEPLADPRTAGGQVRACAWQQPEHAWPGRLGLCKGQKLKRLQQLRSETGSERGIIG
jgi:hypothetical protein